MKGSGTASPGSLCSEEEHQGLEAAGKAEQAEVDKGLPFQASDSN